MTERRTDSRKLTCIFAGYQEAGDAEDHVALIHDVSAQGATLYTRERLDVGERLDLGLLLDVDTKEMSPAKAEVMHCEHRPWESSDLWAWRAGIRFDEPIDKYDDAIAALHEKRPALGYRGA